VKIHLKPTAAFKSRCGTGEHYIEIDPADVYVTAELLDAFGAADKEDVVAAERAADELKAKLVEAEATIERVKAAVGNHPEPCGETPFSCGWKRAVADVRSALTTPKPFELPTEVPARIEAKRDVLGYADVLTLWTDGTNHFWRSEHTAEDWKPEGVMANFTDHRLLDGEA
jgi:hypothetical protein